jgi:hypothetical protein
MSAVWLFHELRAPCTLAGLFLLFFPLLPAVNFYYGVVGTYRDLSKYQLHGGGHTEGIGLALRDQGAEKGKE